ncbi:hypothetical protein ACIRJS_23125 [Streptomyces sp. NPDC102340]|uniref:hypothetical protein n=1 Tax=unclassified Streptomyces TaxID=2593676 RepID=UPI00383033B6
MLLALELPGSKELVSAVVGAVLAFIAALAIEGYKQRRSPQKRLAWTATTRSADVALDDGMRELLQIRFNGTPVDNLTSVEFGLQNTGNTVVRDHQIRLEFPDGCQVLAAEVHPAPEREMAVLRRLDLEEGPREAVFRIGHFEKNRRVSFRIVASGPNSPQWTPISHNESGDVEFREGGEVRAVADAEHVPTFLSLLLLMLALPPLFRWVGAQVGPPWEDLLSMLVYATCLIGILRHITPAFRSVRDTLVALQTSRKSGSDQQFYIYESENFALSGGSMSDIEIAPPSPRTPRQAESPEPITPTPSNDQPDGALRRSEAVPPTT